MNDRILALVPAHNESRSIARVVEVARLHLPVLVVDDGSSDETAACAARAGASVLPQSPNQGKGVALRAGFKKAIEDGYDAVLTLDGDGQHDPAEIPAFLQAYRQRQADLIIGARTFSQMPFSRRLANTLGSWLFSLVLGRRVPDNQSGYRLISRRLIEEVMLCHESGFEFEVEMVATCVRRKYLLDSVPVRTIYAGEASHIKPVAHVLNFCRLVWRVGTGKIK
jgi:glycosyltransferase involved in cell wall biosynthesis